MAGRLQDKVALVTGGSSGIGEAIVRRFAAEGARVVFCARGEDLGRSVEASVRDAGGETVFLPCDVTDESAVDALVAETLERHGRLDVLVANAGGGGADPWPNEPTDTWRGIVDLNLTSMMYLCRAAWPALVAAGDERGASVVAISSLSAWMGIGRDQLEKMGGFAPSASYQAAKAAMDGLTVHLAGVGGAHNVRVNGIRPGRILTDKFREWMGEEGIFWSHYREAQMLKRHGESEDIANAALFLACDESAFVTAQILDVNGGAIVKV